MNRSERKNNRSGMDDAANPRMEQQARRAVTHTKNGLILLTAGYLIAVLMAVLGLAHVDIHPSVNNALSELPKVLIVMGVILVIIGRKRFGSYHKKFGMLAMAMFLFGIIIMIVGTTMIMSDNFAASENPESTTFEDEIKHSMNGLFVSLIGSIMIVIGMVVLVYNLENRAGKIILFMAVATTLVIAAYSLLVSNRMMDEYVVLFEQEEPDGRYERDEYSFRLMYKGLEFKEKLDSVKYYHIFADVLFLFGFIISYWRLKNCELTLEGKGSSSEKEPGVNIEKRKTTSHKVRSTSHHVSYAIGAILVTFLILTGVFVGIMEGLLELPVEKETNVVEDNEKETTIDYDFFDEVLEGNWYVFDMEEKRDMNIFLNGNLIIESGGELVFNNVTLIMGFREEGRHSIGIREGGTLQAHNSLLTAYHTETDMDDEDWWNNFDGSFYHFVVSGSMQLVNSRVNYAKGIEISSDYVSIDNSEITMSEDDGIICEMCSPIINGSMITYQKEGSGIRCINSPAVITNNIIDQSGGWGEDGIYVDGLSPVIVGNTISNYSEGIEIENYNEITISNNRLINTNTGIKCGWHSSNIIIINNRILDNGDGIDVGSSENVFIHENLIRSNNGLGIDLLGADNVTISDNTISYNYIGISCDNSESLRILTNSINSNYIGIDCEETNPFIRGNEISSNYDSGRFDHQYSENDDYCGIYCKDSSPMVLNSTLNDNSCTIYCEDSDVLFSNCTVTGTENFCIISEGSVLSVNNSRIERSFANISSGYYFGDDSNLTINQTTTIVLSDINGGPVNNASISMKDPEADEVLFRGITDENGTISATMSNKYYSSFFVDTGVEYPLEIRTNDTIEETAVRIDEDIEIISGVLKDIVLHLEDIEIIRNNEDPCEITINAAIGNRGSSAAHNISVEFYSDDIIMGSVILNRIEPNSSHVATKKCSPGPGKHRIRIECDPDNTIPETLESNNMGYGEITLDWTVTGEESYKDRIIFLSSNLLIESGGKLTLDNVELAAGEGYFDRFKVIIYKGGELHASDSVIASVHPDQYYDFKVYGKMTLERCVLKGMTGEVYRRYNDDYSNWTQIMRGGVEILSDDVAITDCTVRDFKGVAIYCNNSSPVIEGNRIDDINNSYALVLNSSSSRITGNHFTGGGGLLIYSSSSFFHNNIIRTEGMGLRILMSDVNISSNIISSKDNGRPIDAEKSDLTIRNNVIINGFSAISCDYCNVSISNNTLKDNYVGIFEYKCNSIMKHNSFYNYFAGIFSTDSVTHIENNAFIGQKMVSVTLENSSSFIKNNSIVGEQGLIGIIVTDDSPVEIIDNDIEGFLMGIVIMDSSSVNISNCKISDCLIGIFPSNSTVVLDDTEVHAHMYKLMPFEGSKVELSETNIGQKDIITLTDYDTEIRYDGYTLRKTHGEKFFVSAGFSILVIIILFLLAFYDPGDRHGGSRKRRRERQKGHSSTPGKVLLFSGIAAFIIGLFLNPYLSEKLHFVGSMISPYISRVISPLLLFFGVTAVVMWRLYRKRRAPGHLIMGSAALLGISFSALAVLELVDVRPRYPFVILSIVFFLLGAYPILSVMRKRRPNIRSFVPYLDIWMLGWGLMAVWLSFTFFSLYFFSCPAEELIVAKDMILYGSILGGIGAVSVAMAMLKQRLGRMVYTIINVVAMVGLFVVISILPESICLFLSL